MAKTQERLVKVRFPNESKSVEVYMEPSSFTPTKIFDREVFGEWKGCTVALNKIDYHKFIKRG